MICLVKSIYKITNKINNKVYIGQSKDVHRRFLEHISGRKNGTSVIHNAIEKYGVENFKIETIEKDIENYNEREIYWIDCYNSTDRKFGYNILEGGEEPPTHYGEDSTLCKYSDSTIDNIRFDILNTDMELKDIAKKYGIQEQYVSLLNRGIVRPSNKYTYPIRALKNKILEQEQVDDIVYLLKHTAKSVSEISKATGLADVTIYYINIGEHAKSRKELSYPIRSGRYSNDFINAIIKELQDNKLMVIDICNKYEISRATVSRINNGKIRKIESIQYPIRTSKDRVYQSCRDYPE